MVGILVLILYFLGSPGGFLQCPKEFIMRFLGPCWYSTHFLPDICFDFEVFMVLKVAGPTVLAQSRHQLGSFLISDPLSFCLQVATNGIISAQDLPMEKQYVDDGLPTDFPVVAPFLADIDTSGGRGQIYYRVTETPSVLNRVAQVC